FSSRRRHTRFSRDWSSDVCSSDLFSDNDSSFIAILIVPQLRDYLFAARASLAYLCRHEPLRTCRLLVNNSDRRLHVNAQSTFQKIGRASCRDIVMITSRAVKVVKK